MGRPPLRVRTRGRSTSWSWTSVSAVGVDRGRAAIRLVTEPTAGVDAAHVRQRGGVMSQVLGSQASPADAVREYEEVRRVVRLFLDGE